MNGKNNKLFMEENQDIENITVKKEKFHLRKEMNFKPNLENVSQYVGNNMKGIYYIENNFLTSKPTRYFMYLRKNGLDMNKVFDLILEQEEKKNNNE